MPLANAHLILSVIEVFWSCGPGLLEASESALIGTSNHELHTLPPLRPITIDFNVCCNNRMQTWVVSHHMVVSATFVCQTIPHASEKGIPGISLDQIIASDTISSFSTL
jgi:hypothetical protein